MRLHFPAEASSTGGPILSTSGAGRTATLSTSAPLFRPGTVVIGTNDDPGEIEDVRFLQCEELLH